MTEIPQPEDILVATQRSSSARSSPALLLLGSFNHVIAATIELIFGYRFGAHFGSTFILGDFLLAAAGNMVGVSGS